MTTDNVRHFTIFIENGELKCAPFGIEENHILVYEGISPLTEKRWQHVSCGFHQMQVIHGEYLAYTNIVDGYKIWATSFSKSLVSTKNRLPNYVDAKMAYVKLGGAAMRGYYKDFRVWKTLRSQTELQMYRFRQVNKIFEDLMLEYQFMDGRILYNTPPNTRPGATSVKWDKDNLENVICPSDRLFDYLTGMCVFYPFYDIPVVYMA
jgi:hypothetical protein